MNYNKDDLDLLEDMLDDLGDGCNFLYITMMLSDFHSYMSGNKYIDPTKKVRRRSYPL